MEYKEIIKSKSGEEYYLHYDNRYNIQIYITDISNSDYQEGENYLFKLNADEWVGKKRVWRLHKFYCKDTHMRQGLGSSALSKFFSLLSKYATTIVIHAAATSHYIEQKTLEKYYIENFEKYNFTCVQNNDGHMMFKRTPLCLL